MLNMFARLLALLLLVASVVVAISGDYPHAAYLMGMAVFNQILAQEAA